MSQKTFLVKMIRDLLVICECVVTFFCSPQLLQNMQLKNNCFIAKLIPHFLEYLVYHNKNI